MAQEFLHGWITGHLGTNERAHIRTVARRMGLRDSLEEWTSLNWHLLAWFTDFTQLDLDTLNAQARENLIEDIQVIQIFEHFNIDPWIPDSSDLKQLQDIVKNILLTLVASGAVRIGPIPIDFVIWRGNTKKKEIEENMRPKSIVMLGQTASLIGHPPAEGFSVQTPPHGKESLIYCLAQLLTKYPAAVRRCRNCSRLFARFKTKSRLGADSSCSRECQTRSWAKEQYRKKKELRASAKGQQIPKVTDPNARRKGNGKKRRSR